MNARRATLLALLAGVVAIGAAYAWPKAPRGALVPFGVALVLVGAGAGCYVRRFDPHIDPRAADGAGVVAATRALSGFLTPRGRS